jgi:hypothetical protein
MAAEGLQPVGLGQILPALVSSFKKILLIDEWPSGR